MYLKSNNNNIICSNDIHKIWKFHVLSVEEYYNYCMTKFGKIINYNFIENEDKELLSEMKINYILATINYYKSIYSNFMYKNVWNFNVNLSISDIEVLNNNNKEIFPSYIENIPEIGTIKLYFIYNKQFITYKPSSISETIESLKKLISKEINIDNKNIILKLHSEINIIGFDKNSYLTNGIIKDSSFLSTLINKKYNYIIVELNNEK
jgi:hypothetical protein